MDYQAIVEGITLDKVKQLLYRLGAKEVIDKGTYLITNTICHNADAEDASLKLYYYDNYKVFVCYSNCQTMSIFKFMKHYYETRGIEYDWVSDIYNVILDCSNFKPGEGFDVPKYDSLRNKYGRVKQEKELPEYNHGALDTFVKYYPPEWLRDGISKEAMDKFGIRYSISQNKIIIPHYDVKGRLVGIRGRALNEWEVENVGKYMPVRLEQTWYKHPLSMNLYGLYENQENIKKVEFAMSSNRKSLCCSLNLSICPIAQLQSVAANSTSTNLTSYVEPALRAKLSFALTEKKQAKIINTSINCMNCVRNTSSMPISRLYTIDWV